MQKWIIPSTLAVVVSFFLFVFMANLIGKPTQVPPTTFNLPVVELVPTRIEKNTIKDPAKIKPQPAKKMPPPTRVIDIKDDTPQVTQKMAFDPNLIALKGSIGVGPGGDITTILDKPSQGSKNRDAAPIVQITPQYPPVAARNGTEGWVKLSFSIDKTGSVTNVQILDSSPKRVFDRSARNALKRWRYKAKFVDGVPVIQDNLQVQLDFTIDK